MKKRRNPPFPTLMMDCLLTCFSLPLSLSVLGIVAMPTEYWVRKCGIVESPLIRSNRRKPHTCSGKKKKRQQKKVGERGGKVVRDLPLRYRGDSHNPRIGMWPGIRKTEQKWKKGRNLSTFPLLYHLNLLLCPLDEYKMDTHSSQVKILSFQFLRDSSSESHGKGSDWPTAQPWPNESWPVRPGSHCHRAPGSPPFQRGDWVVICWADTQESPAGDWTKKLTRKWGWMTGKRNWHLNY